MTFASFETILSLFCTIIGLLGCLFKYIEIQKRTCLYLVLFFLSHFLSDYYWTVYVLVMNSYPDVSGFMSNLGWNIGYVFLFLAAFSLLKERKKSYFNPVMLWPVFTNVPQLILYIQFGSIFNNLWQVGITTIVMVSCSGEILYYFHNKKTGETAVSFPFLPLLILLYLICGYGMWTSSCFDWKSDFLNPYFYFSFVTSASTVFFAWGAGRNYKSELINGIEKNVTELRFQAEIQTILVFIIFTLCIGGYFVALGIRDSLPVNIEEEGFSSTQIVVTLFTISAVLVLLILLLLFIFHRSAKKLQRKNTMLNHSRFNVIFTIVFTFVLMMFAVIYNTRKYYEISLESVFEDGKTDVKMTASNLENYLTIAEATLRGSADTIESMILSGKSLQDIKRYLTDQTKMQSEQFDENFKKVYAYINDVYMDGSDWIMPQGFDPKKQEWYRKAVEAGGNIVIANPYLDETLGSVVITLAKEVSSINNPYLEPAGNFGSYNVVCMDVVVTYIKDVTKKFSMSDKGYGMVLNNDGFIVAHHKDEYDGKNIAAIYGPDVFYKLKDTKDGKINSVLEGEDCTLFVYPIMGEWLNVLVVSNAELFENVYSQLITNIMVLFIIFCLISFFYYLGYKNEQSYGKKIEEMNIQVVKSLATAIDAKDKYTNGHSSRVAVYAKNIAIRAGYSKEKQDEIYMIGLLHDVGKIGVPDEVINKTSSLTEEEFELIREHPKIGYEILKSIKECENLSVGARWHHERYDGRGYPDGLAGEKIPEEARIIAVADAYDAMTSRRSYRTIMAQETVKAEIEKGMGTQFDPKFASLMLQMIEEDTEYTMREI